MRKDHRRAALGFAVGKLIAGLAASVVATTALPQPAHAAPTPAAPAPAAKVFNVKSDFGAKGDGVSDDGPAIQQALDAASANVGGGKVFIPQGRYLIDTTLLVGDDTEVAGKGNRTTLMRGNRYVLRPSYETIADPTKAAQAETAYKCKNIIYTPETDKDTSCKATVSCTSIVSKELFSNRHYNCGNKNIYLHDFAIEGAQVTVSAEAKLPIYNLKGEVAYTGANPVGNMGTLSFSATENLRIESLTIRNAPQDAIFVRNGGVNTLIKNNLLDGFTMRWYNGGGVNVEVHANGHLHTTTTAPVVIEKNRIITRNPNFCYGRETDPCASDAECSKFPFPSTSANSLFCQNKNSDGLCQGFCGVVPVSRTSNTAGIATGKRTMDYGAFEFRPHSVIKNNTIELTNRHMGIACTACKDSHIFGNTLRPYSAGADSPGFSGLFTGISAIGDNENINVSGNSITGTGKPTDGRGLHLVGTAKLVAMRNIVSNRDTSGGATAPVGTAVVEVTGFDGVTFRGNSLTDIKHSAVLNVGTCNVCTKNGSFVGNMLKGDPGVTPLYTRKAFNIEGITQGVDLDKNTLSPVKAYKDVGCTAAQLAAPACN